MGGSIQYDRRSRRYFISVYWDREHHRIFSDPNTGAKFFDKRQAAKLLGAIQREVDLQEFNPKHWKPDSPLIVGMYYKEWLEGISVTKKTKRDYTGYFKNHIIPNVGKMDIRHLRFKHLNKLYTTLKLSQKGKYNVMGALKSMLKWAYQSEDIKQMPPFPKLSFSLPEIEYLTLEQQNIVLSNIPGPDRPVFEFGMEYGLRTQEVRALQKDCITETEVDIKRSFSENTLRETTKTGKPRKEPLTDYAVQVIESARKNLSPFVFVRKDGKPYTNKNMNTIWKKACLKSKISIKMQNAFRHSLGCQLLDQGEDLELVRDILGHTKTEMTRRYARRNPASLKGALDKRRRLNVVKIKGGFEQCCTDAVRMKTGTYGN